MNIEQKYNKLKVLAKKELRQKKFDINNGGVMNEYKKMFKQGYQLPDIE